MTAVPLRTRRETLRLARRLGSTAAPGDLLILEGPLGAGKTFFARAFARAAGVDRDERVTSPTFALVHEHETPRGRLLHADLYRVGAAAEARELGLREARGEGAVLVCEWARRWHEALGPDGLVVDIALGRDGVRTAEVTPLGARGASWSTEAGIG